MPTIVIRILQAFAAVALIIAVAVIYGLIT
jgi:hypothetical protein